MAAKNHKYSMYARSIREMDQTVNAVGVEAFMRIEYGTLDHLSREQFAQEIALANAEEAVRPGSMRLYAQADSPATLEEFDRFQQEFLQGENGQ